MKRSGPGFAGWTLLALLLLCGGEARAADKATAILERGPVPRKGIPRIEQNAIPHFYGEYRAEGFIIVIRYTREPILAPGAKAFACGKLPLVTLGEGESLSLLLADGNEFMVFEFQKDFKNPCAFIQGFLNRLRYFQGITPDDSIVPFPAIVEF